MAVASGGAKGAVVPPHPPPPPKKKTNKLQNVFNHVTFWSVRTLLGVDSLNFTMMLPLQLVTTYSFVLMKQQTKEKRFRGKRPFAVPYFLRVIVKFEQPPSLLNMPSET